MRWKIVWRKKPRRTSSTNDAVACGDAFGSSWKVMLPQFVENVTSYVFEVLSVVFGFGACRTAGFGTLVTAKQPSASAAVGVG
jgi:hypothetical protein